MAIGICPNCGKTWEGSWEAVNEGFGHPKARWCPSCYLRPLLTNHVGKTFADQHGARAAIKEATGE